MAGAGYKLFNTGDVLLASEVNTYLMQQTVMVFANASARTTALSSVLAEGMVSYLQDTNVVEIYNGSAWASLDDPNAIQNSIVDAKGDIITATADNVPARLAVGGTNGHVLTVDSSTSTGLKWAAPSTGALVLITTQSFSGSGTINVNDVFSGTYDNYLVKMNYEGSGGTGSAFEMRMRVSGADNTNASYAYQRQTTGNTTVSAARFTGQTIWEVGQAVTGDTQWVEFNFYQPYASAETGLIASSNGNGSTPEWWVRLGVFDNTTSFTGFSIISQRNLAGSLSVYGYAK